MPFACSLRSEIDRGQRRTGFGHERSVDVHTGIVDNFGIAMTARGVESNCNRGIPRAALSGARRRRMIIGMPLRAFTTC
jgi:hypothetical protein